MPTKYKDYPIFTYDEPAIYQNFTGGINTDPSNEHLAENELKDALNTHYHSGSLVKRKGASLISRLEFPFTIFFIQGIFLFSYKQTYIVLAADGKLFWGYYTPTERILLKDLPIIMDELRPEVAFSPINQSHGLDRQVVYSQKGLHDGYILKEEGKPLTLIFQNTKPIEAATYDNKLYIATGTRFVEVNAHNGILHAAPVVPYRVASTESNHLGFNYLSPYPEHCLQTSFDQARTDIQGILTVQNAPGVYTLEPLMNFLMGTGSKDYLFRWEKLVDNTWCVVHTFQENYDGETKLNRFRLTVTDAHTTYYRVTYARSFEKTDDQYVMEPLIRHYPSTNQYDTIEDYTVAKNIPDSGQATSMLFLSSGTTHDTYNIIQSCTKILGDGNKFILYGDRFNSGSWFKTVTGNPSFVPQKGSLCFKTNRNEELLKVVHFNGNLIVFAFSPILGGTIHLVTGAGDDYQDDWYSPYRRKVINTTISTDNANTVQVCENLLFFKHFQTVYYMRSGDLNSDVINVFSVNDRVQYPNPDIETPWSDNNCISEVTENYYALIWKETETRPATRWKVYYKMGHEINNKYYLPWLRDESKFFNVDHILYLKGKPVYLYNQSLLSFEQDCHTDLGEQYPVEIRFRAEDLHYPKLMKLLSNVLIFYHRDPSSRLKLSLTLRNEAGNILLDSFDTTTTQDLRSLRAGTKLLDEPFRLSTPGVESKVFNTTTKFPCLLVDASIKALNDSAFSVSSITYNYTTIETPDTTPYNLYIKIIRKDELL